MERATSRGKARRMASATKWDTEARWERATRWGRTARWDRAVDGKKLQERAARREMATIR